MKSMMRHLNEAAKDRKGISLIDVIIAAGLVASLGLVLGELALQTAKVMMSAQVKRDFELLSSLIHSVVINDTSCSVAIADSNPLSPSSNPTQTTSRAMGRLKIHLPGIEGNLEVGKWFGRVKLTELYFETSSPGQPVPAHTGWHTYEGNIVVGAERKQKVKGGEIEGRELGSKEIHFVVPLRIAVDEDGEFKSCTSLKLPQSDGTTVPACAERETLTWNGTQFFCKRFVCDAGMIPLDSDLQGNLRCATIPNCGTYTVPAAVGLSGATTQTTTVPLFPVLTLGSSSYAGCSGFGCLLDTSTYECTLFDCPAGTKPIYLSNRSVAKTIPQCCQRQSPGSNLCSDNVSKEDAIKGADGTFYCSSPAWMLSGTRTLSTSEDVPAGRIVGCGKGQIITPCYQKAVRCNLVAGTVNAEYQCSPEKLYPLGPSVGIVKDGSATETELTNRFYCPEDCASKNIDQACYVGPKSPGPPEVTDVPVANHHTTAQCRSKKVDNVYGQIWKGNPLTGVGKITAGTANSLETIDAPGELYCRFEGKDCPTGWKRAGRFYNQGATCPSSISDQVYWRRTNRGMSHRRNQDDEGESQKRSRRQDPSGPEGTPDVDEFHCAKDIEAKSSSDESSVSVLMYSTEGGGWESPTQIQHEINGLWEAIKKANAQGADFEVVNSWMYSRRGANGYVEEGSGTGRVYIPAKYYPGDTAPVVPKCYERVDCFFKEGYWDGADTGDDGGSHYDSTGDTWNCSNVPPKVGGEDLTGCEMDRVEFIPKVDVYPTIRYSLCY